MSPQIDIDMQCRVHLYKLCGQPIVIPDSRVQGWLSVVSDCHQGPQETQWKHLSNHWKLARRGIREKKEKKKVNNHMLEYSLLSVTVWLSLQYSTFKAPKKVSLGSTGSQKDASGQAVGAIFDPDTGEWQCLTLLLTCSIDFSPTAFSQVFLISPIILLNSALSRHYHCVILMSFPAPCLYQHRRPWGNHYIGGKPLSVNRSWKQQRWHTNRLVKWPKPEGLWSSSQLFWYLLLCFWSVVIVRTTLGLMEIKRRKWHKLEQHDTWWAFVTIWVTNQSGNGFVGTVKESMTAEPCS